MMLSDYDGSWEGYIDEFAEMILSGLDAIWETSFGYPPDGARDLPAFKQFLRNHQVPSEVFYSAYPDETVLNILDDRAFAHACATRPASRARPSPHREPDDAANSPCRRRPRRHPGLHHQRLRPPVARRLPLHRIARRGDRRDWLRRLVPSITSARPWPVDERQKVKPSVA